METRFHFLWSWRESNPRPNKEQTGFLHAYLVIGFRAKQGNKHPKLCLSFFILSRLRSKAGTSLKLRAVRNQAGIRHVHLRTVPSPVTLTRDSALIYYTSIRLREQNYFRQIKVCDTDLRALSHGSACLHIHSTCCQNRSAPYVKEHVVVIC